MKKIVAILFAAVLLVSCSQKNDNKSESGTDEVSEESGIILSEDTLRDKILGSWVGQMAGVVWGAPTEFQFQGVEITDSKVPQIGSVSINDAFWQDDLYVEIPFIDAMKENGYDCSLKILADSFKETTFLLDHANKIARENLQKGIEAPLSGNYLNNLHCDDIDWQIEADFVGTLYPGLVSDAAARAFEIGHIMNYGDGVYGGVFISAMHSAAFTAKNIDEIVNAGIHAVPEGSQFRSLMDDVIKLHTDGKTWQECWQAVEEKWGKTDRCIWMGESDGNIDAKMNSAYILIGLLYGDGDFNKSMQISMQCGQDSDCNPSSVGAILGNYYGYEKLPAEWKKGLSMTGKKFSYTEYTLKEAVDINYSLMQKVMEAKGFTKTEAGYSIITNTDIIPVTLEQWPDMPSVEASATLKNGLLKMSLSAYDCSGIKSVCWDMGDGTVYNENTTVHLYTKPGKYTVSCVVTNNNDKNYTYKTEVNVTELYQFNSDGKKGTIRNIANVGIPVCSVLSPQGSGSKDLNTIRDGKKSGIYTDQYDTYNGVHPEHEDYIGYVFAEKFKISSVTLTEGMHFDNGGWFADGSIKLQALTETGWADVEVNITPAYPDGNTKNVFGSDFQEYQFKFETITCKGIRIIGKAGGSAGFIGVAELEVTGTEN